MKKKNTAQRSVGKTFGKITILKGYEKQVDYICECGTKKTANIFDIKRGRVVSCGCSRSTPERRDLSRKIAEKNFLECHRGYDRSDDLTPFRYLFKCANNTNRKNKAGDLSLEDIKCIWESQEGKCSYSGVKLLLPQHTKRLTEEKQWIVASLDRIDSSKSYTRENVHIISRTLNLAKSDMTHELFLEFISFIKG